jgi:hypothetical protein
LEIEKLEHQAALQTRLFTINFRFVLNYLISVERERVVGDEGTQVVGVGWVLLQGRGEVVTLLVLRAQLSYGLIMQGNEKKKSTGLLAARSLIQAVPGWIEEARRSDGSSRSPLCFFGTVFISPLCPLRG